MAIRNIAMPFLFIILTKFVVVVIPSFILSDIPQEANLIQHFNFLKRKIRILSGIEGSALVIDATHPLSKRRLGVLVDDPIAL